MRRAVAALAVLAAAGAAAASAGATNECRGLQVCVPVAGPWVVAGGTEVRYDLTCPKGFVVAGLDAELSTRRLDVAFVGGLGSPVNPGITTSTAAVFLGRLLGGTAPAAFRPHVGCIPASGGGQRFPTAAHPVPPGKPLAPTTRQIDVLPGVHRYVERCDGHAKLVGASHAVGFYTAGVPTAAEMRSVTVVHSVVGERVHVVVRAGSLLSANAIVQVDLDCALPA